MMELSCPLLLQSSHVYGRAGHIELPWSCRDWLQADGMDCVVQVQAAALQVTLQLLSGPTPARIPFHDLLGASMTALQSWVDFDGAFMDNPLYATWTQRLLAVLHVLSRASWPQGMQDVARTKLTKVCA
jgi:hypothetical protein